jgi:hypothetical protein
MTNTLDIVLNSSNAALIIFATAAAISSVVAKTPLMRFAAGIAVVALTLCVTISTRSLFAWTASAVERPSFPGFLLLVVLAISATTGRRVAASAEFRFATLALAVAGLVLYPGATGFIVDRDTYVAGYSGYLLPAAVVAVIAYALYRKYFLTAFALNVGIATFLLNAGASRNLWDYVMDPVAWLIGCGTWIAIAIGFIMTRLGRGKVLTAVQPSSGIGETPISH